MILVSHGTHCEPSRHSALRPPWSVSPWAASPRHERRRGAAVLSAFICFKRVFQAQVIIETIVILYDFERYFCALQRARTQFTDITEVLKLFREKSKIVTKKRKKFTQKRIFQVWKSKIPVRFKLILDQLSTFFHMVSREFRKTQKFLSYKQKSVEKLKKINVY